VEFVTDRPKNGRRGSPAIPAGTTLFAIAYAKGGYFPFSYMRRGDAEESRQTQRNSGTDNEWYYPWNVTMNIQSTKHVAPKAEEEKA
jgi:hypothetical protein